MTEEKPQAKPAAATPAPKNDKPAEMEHRAIETITGELRKAIKLDLATSGMSPEARPPLVLPATASDVPTATNRPARS